MFLRQDLGLYIAQDSLKVTILLLQSPTHAQLKLSFDLMRI
jgi:hypothetical protein